MRIAVPVTLWLIAAAPLAAAETGLEARLAEISSGAHRSAENIARNQYRHPVETLAFFGIREDMTVVEILPGAGGWYTEILAPLLREKGRLYAANYPVDAQQEYVRNSAARFLEKLAERPDLYDRVVVTELLPPERMDLGPEGSADLVVTFRNLHGWVGNNAAEQMFDAMFRVLKPGGVLGLVAHRGEPHMSGQEWARKGYVAEADAIRLAEAAGFRLDGRSEINANPKDTKDYPGGVWTLPPAWREGDKDRERFAAIGESDRMTLRFVKPE
jgi:predicted methyltransferase